MTVVAVAGAFLALALAALVASRVDRRRHPHDDWWPFKDD